MKYNTHNKMNCIKDTTFLTNRMQYRFGGSL